MERRGPSLHDVRWIPGEVMFGWCAGGREDPGETETGPRPEPSCKHGRRRRLQPPLCERRSREESYRVSAWHSEVSSWHSAELQIENPPDGIEI